MCGKLEPEPALGSGLTCCFRVGAATGSVCGSLCS
jgi:hypothetical protein